MTEGDVVLVFARGGADQSHPAGSRGGFTHRLEVMAFAATQCKAWSDNWSFFLSSHVK